MTCQGKENKGNGYKLVQGYSLLLKSELHLPGILPVQLHFEFLPDSINDMIKLLLSREIEWHNWPGGQVLSSLDGLKLSKNNFDLDNNKFSYNLFQFHPENKQAPALVNYLFELIESPSGQLALLPWPYLAPSHFWIAQTKSWVRYSLKRCYQLRQGSVKETFNYLYEDGRGNWYRQNKCNCRKNCNYSQLQPINNDKYDLLKRNYEIKKAKRQPK